MNTIRNITAGTFAFFAAAQTVFGAMSWQGAAGADWWGTGNWRRAGASASFVNGEAVVFEVAGASVRLDDDATVTQLSVSKDVTIVGAGTMLRTPSLDVAAGRTATLGVALGEPIVKTGAGELVLTDCLQQQSLDLRAGTVRLNWTGVPAANPFSRTRDANAICGTLDLGGATQAFGTSNGATLFGKDGEIRNGTFNVSFGSGGWWTMSDKTFTVGPGATLSVHPYAPNNESCQMIFQTGARLVIDGGTVANHNDRGSSYGHYIGCDQAGQAEMRILNGGTFRSEHLFVRIGYNGNATGLVSVSNGTFTVASGQNVRIGCEAGATGILAVTNGTVTAGGIQLGENGSGVAKMTFVDSTLVFSGKLYRTNDPAADSFCVMDGCTLKSASSEALNNLNPVPYRLEGRGLTVHPSVDSTFRGYYTACATARGSAPLVKVGNRKLTLIGFWNGRKNESDTAHDEAGVTDFRVEGGELEFDGTFVPVEKVNLTIRNGAKVSGTMADLTASFNSLTVDGTVTFPIAFDANGCTQIKAKTLTLDTTVDHPVRLECTGTFATGVEYCICESLTAEDAAKLKAVGPLAAKLVYRNGKLYAEPSTDSTALTWRGATGADWWGADNWRRKGVSASFIDWDAVVFDTPNAAVRLDADAAVTGLSVSNDVTVTSASKVLSTPCVDVAAGRTARFDGVVLGNDLAKTGPGTLVLTNSPSASAPNVTRVEGTLDFGGKTFAASTTNGVGLFCKGGEIRNGAFNVSFGAGNMWSLVGTTFTVGKGATLTVRPSADENASCQMNFQGGARLVVDGGTVVNANNRGSSYGHYIGCDQAGSAEVRLVNGGTFRSANLFVRIGYNGKATGLVSVDGGTLTLASGQNVRVGCEAGTTGVLAVTNGTVTADGIQLCENGSGIAKLTFVDSTLAIAGKVYKSNDPATGSFCVLDGCTLKSSLASGDTLDNLNKIGYQLEGKGLTVIAANDVTIKGYYTAKTTTRGKAPLIKTGTNKLSLAGFWNGRKNVGDTSVTGQGVTDFQVLGGTLNFTGTTSNYLSVDKLNLTIKNGGSITGYFNDLTAAFNSLTVDGTVSIPIAFTASGCTRIKAKALKLDTTADHPVHLACTGTFAAGVEYCICESLTAEDAAKLKLVGSLGAKLVYRNGKLYAESSAGSAALTWRGATGADWWGAGNWRRNGASSSFVHWDAVLFDTPAAMVRLDADAALTGLSVSNDVTVTGAGNVLSTPFVHVAAGQTATFDGVVLGDDFAKTGPGMLVLTNTPSASAPNVTAVEGTFDLGGRTLSASTVDGTGLFCDGGEIRNGTLAVTFGSEKWWYLPKTIFTVGKGATLDIAEATDQAGEMTFNEGAVMIVDGGMFRNGNNRASDIQGNHIGFKSSGAVRLKNGGTFESPHKFVRVGWNVGGCGVLAAEACPYGVTNAVEIADELRLASEAGVTGIVALTNATLTVPTVRFSETAAGGLAQMTLKDTTVHVGCFCGSYTPHVDSFILFDNVQLMASGSAVGLLPVNNLPKVTVAAGGLTVCTLSDKTISAPLHGTGTLVKTGAGRLTLGVAVTDGFDGSIDVRDGGLVISAQNVLKGNLSVRRGATFAAVNAIVTGNVTIEDGATFVAPAIPEGQNSVVVLKTSGALSIPDASFPNAAGKNRWSVIRSADGSEVRYGILPGAVLLAY